MCAPRIALAAAFAALALASGVRAQDVPHLRAGPAAGMVIDGRLDESAWLVAEVGGGFRERTPHPGNTPPVDTTFRVLFDEGALYVGVECRLAPGESPRALVMTRDDFGIWSDDALSVKIDARRDQRTTIGFVVSASGAQLDYIALDNGRVLRREYDMLWENAVHLEEDRWSVEIRIPAVSLGMSDAEGPRSIGLNISRDHAARAATYDWALMQPEFGAFSAIHYGVVDGIEIGAHGAPVATTIYSLGEYRSHGDDGSEHALRGAIGGESLARVGGDVWTELTVLTDFAQVDLDDALVNLDRFPLFFPERRAFFLNGLDVLDFGVPGILQPFYSRRIGLDARGLAVPVLGGLKVYGREGGFSFAMLDVLTDETASTPAVDSLATRTRVSLGGASYVGTIGLARVPFRWSGADPGVAAHGTAGADLMLRFGDGDRLQLYGFGAATARGAEGPSAAESGGAAGVTFAYLGESFQPRLSATWVEDRFDAQLGFVRRTGASRLRVELPILGRPSGGLRRIQLDLNGELQGSDRFDRFLYLTGEATVTLELDRGWTLAASGDYVEDVVTADFEVHPGRTVRAGTYRGARLSAGLSAPGQSNPSFSLYYSINNAYFGGELHNGYADLTIAFGPHVTLSSSADVYYATLREQDPFWTYGVNALLRVTPSTNFQIDLVGRLDGRSERAIAMARLRWRYMPGSDLYVVWRENVEYAMGQVVLERTVTLKTTFRFDLLL
jgi:hypothetical protein